MQESTTHQALRSLFFLLRSRHPPKDQQKIADSGEEAAGRRGMMFH
jgi:hypothetical protein